MFPLLINKPAKKMLLLFRTLLYSLFKAPKTFKRIILPKLYLLKKILLIITVFFLFLSNSYALTIKEEEKLAKEYLKIISKYFKVIDDPLVTVYINRLGNKIVKRLQKSNFKYKFYVIKESSYNAFAIAGGHIFVHSGLINGLSNEEELAGILAHEVSHVNLRHISKSIDRSKKMTIAQLTAIAAAILLGSGGNGEASAALMYGSVAAMQSISTVYSREHEREADKKGLITLVKAGYHPKGLMFALKLMRSKQWFSEIPSYFKTHPNIDERLAYIASYIDSNKRALDKLKKNSNINYERFKNKIAGSFVNSEIAIQRYREKIAKDPNNSFLNYGYGLALYRSGDTEKAIVHLKRALKKNPFDPHILKEIGIIYYKSGEYQKALPPISGSVSINRYDLEGRYYLGEIYKRTGMLSKAVSIFEDILKIRRYYKKALYSLGETYGKLGNYPEAYYYLGLHGFKTGKYKTSLFHLKKALNSHNDPKKIEEIKLTMKKVKRALKMDQRKKK